MRSEGERIGLSGVRRWMGRVARAVVSVWVVVTLSLASGTGAQTPPPAMPSAHAGANLRSAAQAVPTPAARPLQKADVDAWLDGFFPPQLQAGDIAGAVVVVVKDGQVLTQRGYGYADVQARRPVDPATTMFRVGSVSKLFTWTAVMQLVQAGKLDLDADINRYLDFRIPPYKGRPITLRNLMTHRSGFEETLRKLDQSGVTPLPLGDQLKRWIPHRIFAPGEVPAYSNYGAALAGYIVQRVSGEPFETYIDRHIFAPLGVKYASFRQPLPDHLQPFAAKGYQVASAPAKPYEILSVAPAGSLAISGAAMAPFLIAHLQNGGPLLSPAIARQMHTPGPSLLPRISRMALGFYSEDRNGHRVIAHGGDLRFQHSSVWLFIDDHVGLFVSMNSVGHEGAVSTVRNLLVRQFADRYFPGAGPSFPRVDAATARQHARMMAGYYLGSRRAQSSFMRIGSLLGEQRVVPTATGAIRLVPDHAIGGGQREWREVAPFLWRASDSGDLLEARVVNGRVERFGTTAVSVSQPAPWAISAGWLILALELAFVVALLAALSWPVGAVARRVYGIPLALHGKRRFGYHLTRLAALLSVLAVLGWAYAYVVGFPSYRLINGDMDGLVLLLQIATPLAFLALLAAAAWTAWLAWAAPHGWFAKLWAILLVASAVMAWWGALAFHLVGFGHDY